MFAILIAEEPPKPHIHNFQTLKKNLLELNTRAMI